MSHNKVEWAKLSQLKAGDAVRLDGGFTCTMPGEAILLEDAIGLYFHCNEGKHYIDGQCNDEDRCVGIYQVRP